MLLLSSCASLFTNRAAEKEKAKLYLQMAADQLHSRDYNKAIESCHEALKSDPDFAPAYNHLALVYMETKRYAKSEESYKKALELKPNYPEVLNNYGVLLNRMERYREAIPLFEKAVQDETYSTPENALTNMGYSYYRLGNLAKAKSFHQKALDVLPQFCLASKNMGDVYAKDKNYKKAADFFEQAVTNCPLYEESEYKLGLALMRLGKRNNARAQLEKLIQKHKSGPYVERSSEVLKYLK
jgi:type IV pilus assembly protein PilF